MTEIVKLLIRNAFVLAMVFSFAVLKVTAQSDPPDTGGPTPPNPPDPTEIPIDGGASLLLAGGVAYGLKKLRDHRKKK